MKSPKIVIHKRNAALEHLQAFLLFYHIYSFFFLLLMLAATFWSSTLYNKKLILCAIGRVLPVEINLDSADLWVLSLCAQSYDALKNLNWLNQIG